MRDCCIGGAHWSCWQTRRLEGRAHARSVASRQASERLFASLDHSMSMLGQRPECTSQHMAAWWCFSLQSVCFLRFLHVLLWHCNPYGFGIFWASGCGMLICDVCSLCNGLQSINQLTFSVLEMQQRSQ